MGAAGICFCRFDCFGPLLQRAVVCDMVCFCFLFSIEERFVECSWADFYFYNAIFVRFSMTFFINSTQRCEV